VGRSWVAARAEVFDSGRGQLGGVGALGGGEIGFEWVWIGFVSLIRVVGLGSIGFELGLFFGFPGRGKSS